MVLDSYNYPHVKNLQSLIVLNQILLDHKLTDIFRYLNNTKTCYTWRRRKPVRQAKLDYWLTSETFVDVISSCDILSG